MIDRDVEFFLSVPKVWISQGRGRDDNKHDEFWDITWFVLQLGTLNNSACLYIHYGDKYSDRAMQLSLIYS